MTELAEKNRRVTLAIERFTCKITYRIETFQLWRFDKFSIESNVSSMDNR